MHSIVEPLGYSRRQAHWKPPLHLTGKSSGVIIREFTTKGSKKPNELGLKHEEHPVSSEKSAAPNKQQLGEAGSSYPGEGKGEGTSFGAEPLSGLRPGVSRVPETRTAP